MIRSICGDDFNGLVGDIGLAVSGLRDRFYLSQEPRDPTALEVIIFLPGTADFNGDGTELPPEGIDGEYLWVYETAADDHWIRFIDTDVLPPIGARMTVTYEGR